MDKNWIKRIKKNKATIALSKYLIFIIKQINEKNIHDELTNLYNIEHFNHAASIVLKNPQTNLNELRFIFIAVVCNFFKNRMKRFRHFIKIDFSHIFTPASFSCASRLSMELTTIPTAPCLFIASRKVRWSGEIIPPTGLLHSIQYVTPSLIAYISDTPLTAWPLQVKERMNIPL